VIFTSYYKPVQFTWKRGARGSEPWLAYSSKTCIKVTWKSFSDCLEMVQCATWCTSVDCVRREILCNATQRYGWVLKQANQSVDDVPPNPSGSRRQDLLERTWTQHWIKFPYLLNVFLLPKQNRGMYFPPHVFFFSSTNWAERQPRKAQGML